MKCEFKDEYQVFTYNIYCKELDIGTLDPIISFQSSSIKFLLSYNFDFQTCYSKGVPYANEVQINGLKDLCSEMSINQFVNEVLSHKFIKKTEYDILKFIHDKEKELKLDFPLHQRPLEKDIFINYINSSFPIVDMRETEDGSGFILSHASTESNTQKNHVDYGKAFQNLKERYINRAKALSTIIHKIFFEPCKVDNSRFVVGHNCFVDLMLLYQKMINPLPPTLDDFKGIMCKAKPHDQEAKQSQSYVWDGDDIICKPGPSSGDHVGNLPILYDTRHLMLTLKEWYNSYPKPPDVGTFLRGDKTPPSKRTLISCPKLKSRLFDYFDLSECYDKFCIDRSEIDQMLVSLKHHNVKSTPPRVIKHSPTTSKYVSPDVECPSHQQSTSSQSYTSSVPHEAGYDAHMCAHLFYQLRRTYAHALNPLTPLDPGSGYALFRSNASIFHLTLARVGYIDFKTDAQDASPPTCRPALIALMPLSSSLGSDDVALVEIDARPGSRDYDALPAAVKAAMRASRRVSRFTALAADQASPENRCYYLATAGPTFCSKLVEALKNDPATSSQYTCNLMPVDFRYVITKKKNCCPKGGVSYTSTSSPVVSKALGVKPLSFIITSSLVFSLGITTFLLTAYKGS